MHKINLQYNIVVIFMMTTRKMFKIWHGIGETFNTIITPLQEK